MARQAALVIDVLSWWHAGTGRGGGEDADALVARDGNELPYLPGRHVKGLLRDACLRLELWDALGPGGNFVEVAQDQARCFDLLRRLRCGTTDRLFGSDPQELSNLEAAFRAAAKKAGRPWPKDQGGDRGDTRGDRHRTHEGCLAIGNAVLPPELRRALSEPPGTPKGQGKNARLRRRLFAYMSATAIEEATGVAKTDSLRRSEVTVPLTLRAPIRWMPEARRLHATEEEKTEIAAAEETWPQTLKNLFPLVRAVGAHRSRGYGRAQLALEILS